MKKLKPFTGVIRNPDGSKLYVDTRNGQIRKRWWTKARVPGTIRKSRMPGGSGFRNNWEY